MFKVCHSACWINLQLKIFYGFEKFLISLNSFVWKKCIKKRDYCTEANSVDCIKPLKKMTRGSAECSIGKKATTLTKKVKVTLSAKYMP